MQSLLRVALFVVMAFSLSAPILSAPSEAATNAADSSILCDNQAIKRHSVKHTVKHKASHKKPVKADSSAYNREAQEHLKNLGYYNGPIDGKLGPKSRAALKAFQKDHGLKPTGKLDAKTMAALRAADKGQSVAGLTHDMTQTLPPMEAAPQKPDFYATHPDFYGYYDQQYSDPLMLAREHSNELSQAIPSRYGQLTVTEIPNGTMKKYNVTLNGQPILMVDNQPSVIGISRTLQLDNEDAIIFTTFNPDDTVCSYQNVLVTLRANGTEQRQVGNCTHEYNVEVKNNQLFIVFPEFDDKRAVGATWRYDAGDLERL